MNAWQQQGRELLRLFTPAWEIRTMSNTVPDTVAPCVNCDYAVARDAPCGTIADCCPVEGCNCAYYTSVPDAPPRHLTIIHETGIGIDRYVAEGVEGLWVLRGTKEVVSQIVEAYNASAGIAARFDGKARNVAERIADKLILLPCPFCGSSAFVSWDGDADHPDDWSVQCDNTLHCGAAIAGMNSEVKAMQAWNTRFDIAARSTVKEDVLALLEECDNLLVSHHSSTMANGWEGFDCPVCSNTGNPGIFRRLSAIKESIAARSEGEAVSGRARKARAEKQTNK